MMARRLIAIFALSLLLMAGAQGQEKIRLMYLESEQETRAAVLIGRLELPLEVYRVGIFRVRDKLYGVVRFGAGSAAKAGSSSADDAALAADRHRVGTTVAMLCDRIFGEFPELVRIDFEGVSQRETKTEKPSVLFSATVDRGVWKNVPKKLPGLERLAHCGALYFDPTMELGEPPRPKIKAVAKPAVKPGTKKVGPKKPATRDQGSNGESKKS